jgi:ubiquinone/menaquinone biosynthesis C-methylase UbiE
MRLSRDTSIRIQYVLDHWLPPVVRDAKWFMRPALTFVFKDKTRDFMDFKDHAFTMTDEEFADVYRRTASVSELQGETDLNDRCTDEILRNLVGENVLEVGCGRGYLAGRMCRTHPVTAVDIVVSEEVRAKYPAVTFLEANIERLPFDDGAFDTVVCTHTLEHVQNLPQAVAELRRVTRRRLIIVVPRQRPYQYSFSLHIHFFPYAWSLQSQLGVRPGSAVRDLGDWYYQEDTAHAEAGEAAISG